MEQQQLPSELIEIVLSYLPPFSLVWLNRAFYGQHHGCIKGRVKGSFLHYVRRMIERDNDFVFARIVDENIDEWLQRREYVYKNMIFNNGIYFFRHLCYEEDSTRCYQLIEEELDKRNLKKNLHKKNIVKYISNHSYSFG